ncbi:Uncharacterised protein [Vibrio cholerae]|nr:Uncharacterised protein [Vibrio cholerae]
MPIRERLCIGRMLMSLSSMVMVPSSRATRPTIM